MKAMIFYWFLTVLCFGANAQGRELQNFKKLKNPYGCFIIPLDFEQKFKVLQQEAFEKDFYIGILKSKEKTPQQLRSDSITRVNLKKRGVDLGVPLADTIDSLSAWLYGSDIVLSAKEGISTPYPREWIEVATAWAEQLKEREEEIDLSIYALVNNTGKVLSVYFGIFPVFDGIQEEDLRAIGDAVAKKPFDPDNFDFNRRDQKLMKEFSAALHDRTRDKEERLALGYKAMETKKPCVYGVLCFFRMKCNEKRQ